MTEIEKKALALLNEIRVNQGYPPNNLFIRTLGPTTQALCRAIEQHEAYKQDVSDAIKGHFGTARLHRAGVFRKFIIPEPSADPLVEVFMEAQHLDADAALCLTLHTREGLAKRGLKIVEDV